MIWGPKYLTLCSACGVCDLGNTIQRENNELPDHNHSVCVTQSLILKAPAIFDDIFQRKTSFEKYLKEYSFSGLQ